jgi:hypothetical protein
VSRKWTGCTNGLVKEHCHPPRSQEQPKSKGLLLRLQPNASLTCYPISSVSGPREFGDTLSKSRRIRGETAELALKEWEGTTATHRGYVGKILVQRDGLVPLPAVFNIHHMLYS